MANVDTTYKPSIVNRPSFEQMDTYVQSDLTAGAEPGREQPVRIMLSDNQNLAKFAVVGLAADKRLVMATYNATPANAITPIGVLEHASVSGAANTTTMGEVVLTGVYNVGDDDLGTGSPLVWDASFTTAAQKIASVVGNALLIFRRRKVLS
jgi:hypothetical protein